MTWSRVIVVYAALVVLAGAFVLTGRTVEETASIGAPPPAEASLLGAEPEAIAALRVSRGDRMVSARVEEGRWRVEGPLGADVPPDLFAAFVGTLTAGQASDVMQGGGDLAEFGLVTPASEIEITMREPPGKTIRVLLGHENPPRTALYAKRDDRPDVFLVGLNVRYYGDLILNAAK